jgi:hypothetical protein
VSLVGEVDSGRTRRRRRRAQRRTDILNVRLSGCGGCFDVRLGGSRCLADVLLSRGCDVGGCLLCLVEEGYVKMARVGGSAS